MTPLTFYFTVDDAIAKHDEIIEKSGGLKGVLQLGMLESALEHIQNDTYYPDFIDKLTHIVDKVNRQVFVDGSKRSAITLGAYFLEINGYDQIVVDTFIKEMENPILLAAQSLINRDDLYAIIYDIVTHLELSDLTKVRFIKLLS
jgi:death on curing protein